MNIDFSKFHKLETDDKCTTLQHPAGHIIKIAHKHLKPEHQKELDKLPMKMAKGGKITYQQFMSQHGSKPSKPSDVSEGKGAAVPEAAYTPPKMAKDAYTEPDNIGTKPVNDVVLSAMHRDMPPLGPMGAEKPHYPPCINPSCKSYGHSHPNCRCYGGNPQGKPRGEMPGMFAEGGEAKGFCSEDRMHDKGCQYFAEKGMVEEPPSEDTSQAPVPEQTPDAPQAGPDINMNPEQTSVQPAQQQMPFDNSESQTAPSEQTPDPIQAGTDHAAATTRFLTDEDKAMQNDINNGWIKPETYHDLFAKKDTLGKIGTIFGLLLGGAGGGHGKNAALGMMDNIIQRDLDAQQNSAINRQNLMKISQQGLLNNATAQKIGMDTQVAGNALTNMKANRFALDYLMQQRKKIPNGSPDANQWDQMLTVLSPMIDQKNASIAGQAGLASAISNFGLNGQGGAQAPKQNPQGAVNYDKMNQLQKKTLFKLPGSPPEEDINKMGSEAAHLDQIRALRNDYQNGFDQINNMTLKGELAKNQRNAIIKGLEAKAAPITGVNHAESFVDSQMPAMTDIGKKTADVKKGSLNQYFNVLEAGHPTLQRYGLINPPQQQMQTKAMNGNQYQKVAGGWKKVK